MGMQSTIREYLNIQRIDQGSFRVKAPLTVAGYDALSTHLSQSGEVHSTEEGIVVVVSPATDAHFNQTIQAAWALTQDWILTLSDHQVKRFATQTIGVS